MLVSLLVQSGKDQARRSTIRSLATCYSIQSHLKQQDSDSKAPRTHQEDQKQVIRDCSEMLANRFPLQVLNHFHSNSVTETISLNSHLVIVLSILDGCMVPIRQFLTHSVKF